MIIPPLEGLLDAVDERRELEVTLVGVLIHFEPIICGFDEGGEIVFAGLAHGSDGKAEPISFELDKVERVVPGTRVFTEPVSFSRLNSATIIQLERRFICKMAPQIGLDEIPEPEREEVKIINANLRRLQHHIDAFEAAVSLFEFCESRFLTDCNRYVQWMRLAGRDGIVTIQRFEEVRSAFWTNAKKCPSLHIDYDELGAGGRLFREAFPDALKHRHAVAHSGLKGRNAENHIGHSIASLKNEVVEIKQQEPFHVSDMITMGRTFSNTWDGQYYSQRLDRSSLYKLDDVKMHIWHAFTKQPDDL